MTLHRQQQLAGINEAHLPPIEALKVKDIDVTAHNSDVGIALTAERPGKLVLFRLATRYNSRYSKTIFGPFLDISELGMLYNQIFMMATKKYSDKELEKLGFDKNEYKNIVSAIKSF